ncbi:hypothetical protein ACSQ67_010632 [Phaseolus vulgaris]
MPEGGGKEVVLCFGGGEPRLKEMWKGGANKCRVYVTARQDPKRPPCVEIVAYIMGCMVRLSGFITNGEVDGLHGMYVHFSLLLCLRVLGFLVGRCRSWFLGFDGDVSRFVGLPVYLWVGGQCMESWRVLLLVMPILGWARVAGWVISVIGFGCFVGKGGLLLLMMDCLSVHGASNGAFVCDAKAGMGKGAICLKSWCSRLPRWLLLVSVILISGEADAIQGQIKAVLIQGQIGACIKLCDARLFFGIWIDVATWF